MNKKILVINQPTGNRGDESAHKALIRSLMELDGYDITVAFFGETKDSIGSMPVKAENVQYYSFEQKKGKISFPMKSLKYKVPGVLCLLPNYRKLIKCIKSTDYVICAPGGICMGKFMNWDHIYWLERTMHYKKPLAYYSRSFGPFEDKNDTSKLFNRLSRKILKDFTFLSIRDSKTVEMAKMMGLNYVESIDTAFLEIPQGSMPSEITTEDYVVFVPNELTWHPAFRNVCQDQIDSFYCKVVEVLNERFPDSTIVMMPQLFGQGNHNDYRYFKKIQRLLSDKQIVVLPDIYSSDIQQTVIRNSKYVVGARYHSIVFAINNGIPFTSLSYEHKMFGLLNQLNLQGRQVDITNIGTDSFDLATIINNIKNIQDTAIDICEKQIEAKEIALKCFESMKYNFFEK